MRSIWTSLLILIVTVSCQKDIDKKIDISNIRVDFKINRFEEVFYKSTEDDLPRLKNEYAVLFPKEVNDSVWIAKMKNDDELYLFNESQKVFGDFKNEQKDLEQLFKYIKYYNPKFSAPRIITHISDIDYQYPVIYADSLLFISLDMYLGVDNIVYEGFPQYLSQNFKKKRLVVDVANDIIVQSYPKVNTRIFLNRIIEEGKRIYLLDRFLPEVSDDLKMGYSVEKLRWAQDNEINVWKYFIENELLYSNDSNLNMRFINISPFSKFYQEADQDSPGRIGVWIGWQIVRSYMENNDVDLQQLLITDSEDIFKKSKYKPKK
ncbi:MAG: gliding motility lipoprotein GldB [Flavobacteriaceae bacterium]